MLLILDLQVGLYQLARDWDATLYRDNMMAHAELGKLFDLPVVMTTSAQTGPNGPLPKEMLALYPNAPLIQRQGEVKYATSLLIPSAHGTAGADYAPVPGTMPNSVLPSKQPARSRSLWQASSLTFVPPFSRYRSALKDTVSQPSYIIPKPLLMNWKAVFANIEGSGTTTQLIRDTANSRMEKAGVQLVSLFSIVCDLMRDWRNTPGAAEVLPYLDKYMPVYGMLARGHAAAVNNGTIIPGEAGLV